MSIDTPDSNGPEPPGPGDTTGRAGDAGSGYGPDRDQARDELAQALESDYDSPDYDSPDDDGPGKPEIGMPDDDREPGAGAPTRQHEIFGRADTVELQDEGQNWEPVQEVRDPTNSLMFGIGAVLAFGAKYFRDRRSET